MNKTIIVIASALALSVSAFAQEPAKSASHFKFYGFVRNYFAFDTRVSSAGTDDLYYYMPKDESISASGEDLNASPSFRFAALTSRAGVDVSGYEFDGYKIAAKIEADFYAGLTGNTGTAQFRLRQAYVTLAKGSRNWKVGQAWHPMAADLPDIFSLESGVPFGAFSRTPQVTLENSLGKGWSLTASALWQMQYTSTGPEGAVANYIKYSCTPEIYLGLNYKWNNGVVRFGADMLSIKPRKDNGSVKVSDRLTTFNFFTFGQYKVGDWTLREKLTYANDGSHFNMVGGYGVSGINSDGSWSYAATRNFSAWFTAMYKPKNAKWVPSLFLGYLKEFGTSKDIVGEFWCKNSANSVNQMYRIQPEIVYNLGKVQFGAEYMCTAVQYGKADVRKLASDNLHWVMNHRIQMMVKYTF